MSFIVIFYSFFVHHRLTSFISPQFAFTINRGMNALESHRSCLVASLVSPPRFPSHRAIQHAGAHRIEMSRHLTSMHTDAPLRDPVGTSSLSLHSSLALLLSSLLHPRAKNERNTSCTERPSPEGGMLRILTTLNSQHNARGEEKVKRETKKGYMGESLQAR